MDVGKVKNKILLAEIAKANFLGSRYSAGSLRQKIIDSLLDNEKVLVDFNKVNVTQSFVDELLGRIILELGPSIIKRLSFMHCSDATKAIIKLVISTRIDDYNCRLINESTAH